MGARNQSGFSMLEVLITIAILLVGLLGLAGLQTRVATAELEAYQRAQALVLVQELADRITANKKNAATYVTALIDPVAELNCVGLVGRDRDMCEFQNGLFGASEKKTAGGPAVGAMIGARACVTSPGPNVYIITIAWQGIIPTGKAPVEACGAGLYGPDDSLRRTVSMPLRVATLLVT